MMAPNLLFLLLAIPIGYLIAWLARDELIAGKKFFKALIGAAAILIVIFSFFGNLYIVLTLIFISVVSFVSLKKSYDKIWTGKL